MWHSEASCACNVSIPEHLFKTRLPIQLGKQQMTQLLAPLPPMRQTQWELLFLGFKLEPSGKEQWGEPENKAHSLSFFFLTLHHGNFQINMFKKITKKNLKSMHIGDVRNTHEACLKLRFPIFIFSIKFSKNPYIHVCI